MKSVKKQGWIVISLGGSLIVPKAGIDVGFLSGFRDLAKGLLKDGYRLIIVTGGGTTARHYQEAGKELGLGQEELDWLGIRATRLNATLVKNMLPEAAPAIITNPEEDELTDARITVAAGWKPGWSTDYDAAVLAKRVGAKRIVNLSNVAYVYEQDPRQNPDAKKHDEMSWEKFRSIIGSEWVPGMNAPFDPVAAKLCEAAKLQVAIVSGEDLQNAKKAMTGKFKGTLIG